MLDEDDYSRREYEATIKNIAGAAWWLKHDYNLPRAEKFGYYQWLTDHEVLEIVDADDRGGYPSEESLRRAFTALGYERIE